MMMPLSVVVFVSIFSFLVIIHLVHGDEQELKEYEKAFYKMPTHSWPYARVMTRLGILPEYCGSYLRAINTSALRYDSQLTTNHRNTHVSSVSIWYREIAGMSKDVDMVVCSDNTLGVFTLVRSAKSNCVHRVSPLLEKYLVWYIEDEETCNFYPNQMTALRNKQEQEYKETLLPDQRKQEYEQAFQNMGTHSWPEAEAMKTAGVLLEYCRAYLDHKAMVMLEENYRESRSLTYFDRIRRIPHVATRSEIHVSLRNKIGVYIKPVDMVTCTAVSPPNWEIQLVLSDKAGCVFQLINIAKIGLFIDSETCNFSS